MKKAREREKVENKRLRHASQLREMVIRAEFQKIKVSVTGKGRCSAYNLRGCRRRRGKEGI